MTIKVLLGPIVLRIQFTFPWPPHVHYFLLDPSSLSVSVKGSRAGVTESTTRSAGPTDQVFDVGDCIPAAIVEQVCSSGHCVSHLCHVISHLPAVLDRGTRMHRFLGTTRSRAPGASPRY